MQKSLHVVLLLFSLSMVSYSQETKRPSPLAMTTIRFQDTYLKITYSQPQKRNREIFGNLVPYGQADLLMIWDKVGISIPVKFIN